MPKPPRQPRGDAPIADIYSRLLRAFGPQGWWPAESPTEVVLGAVLVQNTSWENVVRAIANLKSHGPIDIPTVHALPRVTLERLIKPAGPYRVKAERLGNLLSMIVDGFGGSLDALFALPLPELRATLLAVNGVGRETADSIALYAAGKPTFVIDAYTRRVLGRHGWLAGGERYDWVRERFEQALPRDADLYGEYHALLVEVAKRYCRPRPRCEGCPLAPLLPAGGPIEAR